MNLSADRSTADGTKGARFAPVTLVTLEIDTQSWLLVSLDTIFVMIFEP